MRRGSSNGLNANWTTRPPPAHRSITKGMGPEARTWPEAATRPRVTATGSSGIRRPQSLSTELDTTTSRAPVGAIGRKGVQRGSCSNGLDAPPSSATVPPATSHVWRARTAESDIRSAVSESTTKSNAEYRIGRSGAVSAGT